MPLVVSRSIAFFLAALHTTRIVHSTIWSLYIFKALFLAVAINTLMEVYAVRHDFICSLCYIALAVVDSTVSTNPLLYNFFSFTRSPLLLIHHCDEVSRPSTQTTEIDMQCGGSASKSKAK